MRNVNEEALYASYRVNGKVARSYSLGELRRLHVALRTLLVNTIPGQIADLDSILQEWQPDALVCDPLIWAPYTVLSEARSIPVAVLSWTTACMISGTGDAAVGADTVTSYHLGTPPAQHDGRGHCHLCQPRVSDGRECHPRSPRSAPISMPIMDYAGTMPLYLVTSAPEFDYNRRDLPPSVHYVGWCAWSVASSGMPGLSGWPSCRRIGQSVYVTEGTIEGGPPRLLQVAARGLADLPMQVLLKDAQILEPGRDPAAVGLAGLAPNMRLEGYVAGQGWQREALARASVVVTNGGAGSVLASLAAGAPLVVVPTTWDKPENARRVIEAGAGVQIAPRRCTPRLRAAVEEVLGDLSYRQNATRIAQALPRCGGPSGAAEIIKRLPGHAATVQVGHQGRKVTRDDYVEVNTAGNAADNPRTSTRIDADTDERLSSPPPQPASCRSRRSGRLEQAVHAGLGHLRSDDCGNRHLDFLSGYATLSLGRNSPASTRRWR